METVVLILQFLIFIGAVSVFFIGIFKPSFLLKRKFAGRRIVLILSSFIILMFIGILEDYKIEHIYTNEEREQYYAERREKAVQDSIKKVEKQREKLVRDSIKLVQKQQKELQPSTKDNENQKEKLEEDKSQTTKENKTIEQEDITYRQYPGIVSDIKYKNKRIIGMGLEALKKKNSRYEIVAFTFKNNTNQPYMLSSENFRLYDGENYYGVSIDAQIEAELTTNILGAYTLLDIIDEINPQVTRKYKLIFEVPKKGNYKLVCTNNDIFIKHQ